MRGFFLLLFSGLFYSGISQSSYSVESSFLFPGQGAQLDMQLNFLSSDEEDELWLIGKPLFPDNPFSMEESPVIFLNLTNQGLAQNAYAVGISENNIFRTFDYDYAQGFHALSARNQVAPNSSDTARNFLIVSNFEENIFWSRQTTNIGYFGGPLTLSADRIYYYQNDLSAGMASDYPPFIGIGCSLTQNGQAEWNKKYAPALSPLPDGLIPVKMEISHGGRITLLGQIENTTQSQWFLLQIDSLGQIAASSGFDSDSPCLLPFGLRYDSAGNLLIYGKSADGNCLATSDGAFLVKISPQFELLWAKQLTAPNFEYNRMDISTFPDGRIQFVYIAFGDLPVISGTISPEGDLLDLRGHSFYDPQLAIGTSSTVFFASSYKYLPDGSKALAPLLAKTDETGAIGQCPGYVACLNLADITLSAFPIAWQITDNSSWPQQSVLVEPFEFETNPYCGSPSPPEPYFFVPDTICQGTCLAPDSLNNRLAHRVEWSISGPDIDTLIVDSTFLICLNQPGAYWINQQIWLLGCVYSFQRQVSVLSSLESVFEQSDTLCGNAPVFISVSANRPIQYWLWDDGSSAPQRLVWENGLFAVTISDGTCQDTLEKAFVLAEELLENGFPIIAPADTIVCVSDLPFLLQPQSPYPLTFSLPETGESGTTFYLPEAGKYTLTTAWSGCPYYSVFELLTDSCTGRLYWPNIFSPNHDGINDRWFPDGADYELLEMRIYDRWGALIWMDTSPPIWWEGLSQENAKPAGAGVYIAVVQYRHLVSGMVETDAHSVTLIR